LTENKSLQGEYIKWAIAQKIKHNYTCQICKITNDKNKSQNPLEKIVCHHIMPVSSFGAHNGLLMDERNIIVVCEFCHQTVCHKRSLSVMAFVNYFQGEHGRGNLLNKADVRIKSNVDKILKKYGRI